MNKKNKGEVTPKKEPQTKRIKREGTSQKLKSNSNAVIWTEETSEKLFQDLEFMAENYLIDFVGTLLVKNKVSRSTITTIITKFPEFSERWDYIRSIVESNCYENGKSSRVSQMHQLNLKSNFNWTDRIKTDNQHQITPFNIKDMLSFDDEDENDEK